NELYVDVIELITATIAPSGRPLSARANGTIAFTSKLSGVPDLLLTLQAPNSHKQKLGEKPNSILQYPVFHPCVRLSRWRDHPGELSFVPPDGKFVLASYEVNLLPSAKQQLQLPVTIDMKTAIGPDEDEFEVRVFVNTTSLTPAVGNGSSPAFGSRSGATRSPAFGGSSNVPVVEEVAITIPLPPAVKTLVATRCSRGEFHHEGREVLWKIPTTGSGAAPSSTATFRTGVQIRAMADDDDDDEEEDEVGEGEEKKDAGTRKASARKRRFKMAMPRCAIVNFSVKGWLASGVRVDSVKIVGGRGMGEGVKPYKGVKYITRAGGIEVRC
ncbi:Mu homology domain-containing protein, partial [Sphaerosporella brunnea]